MNDTDRAFMQIVNGEVSGDLNSFMEDVVSQMRALDLRRAGHGIEPLTIYEMTRQLMAQPTSKPTVVGCLSAALFRVRELEDKLAELQVKGQA